jgi:hypothetical protein
MRVVEFRTYRLKPGSREQFHRLLIEKSVPLMQHWGIDVLGYGPSMHDTSSYYLTRSFADLADLEALQAAFYASADWRCGPRKAIVDLIESDSNVVMALRAAAIDALRG